MELKSKKRQTAAFLDTEDVIVAPPSGEAVPQHPSLSTSVLASHVHTHVNRHKKSSKDQIQSVLVMVEFQYREGERERERLNALAMLYCSGNFLL